MLVHRYFEHIAKNYPSSISLVMGNCVLTYEQLERKSNQIAHYLISQNIRPHDVVGICLHRSFDSIATILGVLKSGAAYLPLDPEYPQARIQYMLNHSLAKLVISENAFKNLLGHNCKTLEDINLSSFSEQGPLVSIEESSPAYVIYTSGSTGAPKGVVMGHVALANLLEWQNTESQLGLNSVTLQFTPMSFDVHFQEIFSTLSLGGRLVLIREDERLDSQKLLSIIDTHKINRLYLPYVALSYLAEGANKIGLFPKGLKEITTAGEQLKITPTIRNFLKGLNDVVLFNHYGPTETHVVTSFALKGNPDDFPDLPCIGKNIFNVECLILDKNQKAVEKFNEGELYIKGLALAQGYLYSKELTSEKFIDHPQWGRIYKTGDLVKLDSDHNLVYLGRVDSQVKIRGNRAEISEIELNIQKEIENKFAVVKAIKPQNREAFLCVYFKQSDCIDYVKLKAKLRAFLPEFMIPSFAINLSEFPLTPSGKIDYKNLPDPGGRRPDLAIEFVAAQTHIQREVQQVWQKILLIDDIGIDDVFFDLGGTSLAAISLLIELNQKFNQTIKISDIFQYPSIRSFAEFINLGESNHVEYNFKAKEIKNHSHDIAIIAMTGRFPGAKSTEELWDNLINQKSGLTHFKKDEVNSFVSKELREDPNYVFIEGAFPELASFDYSLFGISPREAELMDPQQRKFLELCYEALELAGYKPKEGSESIGIFAGMGNSYYQKLVFEHPEKVNQMGEFNVMLGLEKDYISTKVAYKLNLKGPALSIHTGCSTSLVAIIEACLSLRSQNCNMALAGAISISGQPKTGHLYIEGGMLSKDGRCTPFDSDATGTVFSEGGGVLVLKRLEDAISDKDSILAVIKGIGLNNDGANKMSFTAPSVEGQYDAILKAQIDGNIHPETIGYVEAHGTATPIGDPIEVEALRKAFRQRTDKKNFCVLSSIKSNIGHLTAAAGVAGVIKSVLILQKKIIPGTQYFKSPNPHLEIEESPFILSKDHLEFKVSDPMNKRRAAVSSFGVGGTNAHIILEEYVSDEISKTSSSDEYPTYQVLKLSARSPEQLVLAKQNLINHLKNIDFTNLEKMAFTLDIGRQEFKYKAALVIKNKDELQNGLSGFLEDSNHHQVTSLVFTFPGQGSHYFKMSSDLYEKNLIYRTVFEHTIKTMAPYLNYNLKEVIFSEKSEELLNQTYYSQPAIFVVQYSLAQTLITLGVKPNGVVGHSVGEFAAAAIAGIFSLEDACRAISKRAELVSKIENGKMLFVLDTLENTKKSILEYDLDIAAINGRKGIVVAGANEEVDRFAIFLKVKGVASIAVNTSHAFHSKMMESARGPFLNFMESIQLRTPSIPMFTSSGISKNEEALRPDYWSSHIRETVNFLGAVEKVVSEFSSCLFLEVGTKNITSNFIKKELIHRKSNSKVISLLTDQCRDEDYSFKKSLALLWMNSMGWDKREAMYSLEGSSRIIAPTMIFDKNVVWIERKKKEEMMKGPKLDLIEDRLIKIIEESSGIDIRSFDKKTSFLEMGMDSLFLTQISLKIKKDLKINISFRQLLEEYSSIEKLSQYVDSLSLEVIQKEAQKEMKNEEPKVQNKKMTATQPDKRKTSEDRPIENLRFDFSQMNHVNKGITHNHIEEIIKNQLEVMSNQLLLLSNQKVVPENSRIVPGTPRSVPEIKPPRIKESFGAQAKISVEKNQKIEMINQDKLKEFIGKYNERTKHSKKFAQENRINHADPRVVTGFKPESKEIVYPIVIKKSYLQSLWDLDNNRYIDMTCGFGSNFFGNGNDRIKKYVLKQIEEGIELGPQHPLVSDVSQLINEITGNERTAFCNTGSEAVLGAMRIARTVSGREKIIVFNGSYHGINDEVIIRGSKNGQSYPAAPGINFEAVSNMIVLDYGTSESLEFIKAHSHEVAAILVEPVQSRRCDFQPREFLKEIREITLQTKTCLIFDEIITGFRIHAKGAQGYFDIRADLCTYGKIVGGGMPIGVISGKSEFMDALDGGFWAYGDDSTPTVGVTYFAGTFVRHPLALAAALGALQILKEGGDSLYTRLNQLSDEFANEINVLLNNHAIPMKLDHFGALMKPKWNEEVVGGEFFFAALRYNGVHVYDGFPWFVNLAHTKDDLKEVVLAFKKSIQMMMDLGIFQDKQDTSEIDLNIDNAIFDKKGPPMPAARIGKDEDGNPAWFVEDENNPGKYYQIKVKSK